MIAPPLALYIHFPWCVAKCPYCDFNSHALREELPEARYVAALLQDLRAQLDTHARTGDSLAGRQLTSIFMGGGTPSLFSPQAIGRILEQARSQMRFAADIEITLEANPGTIERGRFAEYRAAGVTRVSLGAQSFDAAQLLALGRIHSPLETQRAVAELHAAGLGNFNLDLMYALPQQSLEAALYDVETAIALNPAHLSHYHLTMEPGTVFAAAPPVQPADDVVEQMLDQCTQTLADAGFDQYEVSAYARAGRQCAHNLNYWNFGDYLGIGAGAHGKVTNTAGIERTTRPREPRRYLAAAGEDATRRKVPEADLPFEFLMNSLRLRIGFTESQFAARTGLAIETISPQLAAAEARGWLRSSAQRWQPTDLGLRFLNDLLLDFLPDPKSAR